jgi:hypothetical protein
MNRAMNRALQDTNRAMNDQRDLNDATEEAQRDGSGAQKGQRKGLNAVFNNEGMRPALGSEFLYSRHLPDDMQGHFVYGCVINMNGIPRFEIRDDGAGYTGKRAPNLLNSSDRNFRPGETQIGPDGAIWFLDWHNPLIGHMQHNARDPLRDHVHGRIYRITDLGLSRLSAPMDVKHGSISKARKDLGKAAASADLEYFFMLLDGQILEHPGLYLGRQHALTGMAVGRQRNFKVSKGQGLVCLGHKVFPFDHGQQGQHLAVEHLPGADLLLDHIESGLFEIHGSGSSGFQGRLSR